MFCRRCTYDLRQSSDSRCPECDTPFDPDDARTFLSEPQKRLGDIASRWVARTALGFLVVSILASLLLRIFLLDVSALILLALTPRIRAGGVVATEIALVLFALYVVSALLTFGITLLSPPMNLAGRLLHAPDLVWLTPTVFVVSSLAVANVRVLLRAKRALLVRRETSVTD